MRAVIMKAPFDVEVGSLVVVEPFIGCGRCYPCSIGKSNCCINIRIIGVHLPGGYAEYLRAPATHIHLVPEGLSFFDASFTEPTAIGVQAYRRGQVTDGDTLLVLGCGPIGLTLIEVGRARGAQVIAADLRQESIPSCISTSLLDNLQLPQLHMKDNYPFDNCFSALVRTCIPFSMSSQCVHSNGE